jgi:cyclopropane fatty-acyl-phospholipid synthase-like methyltransferase
MPATTGERQIGNTREQIAPNHTARYQFACDMLRHYLPPGKNVLDAACGVGYGSEMISELGHYVTAIDQADESALWQQFFSNERIRFIQTDIFNVDPRMRFDAVVSLETIEHVDEQWVSNLTKMTDLIIGTVPNQDVVPFSKETHKFHLKHYTMQEVLDLFPDDWIVGDFHTQYGKWENFKMVPGSDGMTIGFVARKK